jgi:opine dehydrogenase
MTIAVLGSGNGGCTVAADCALHGHEVRLFDFDQFDHTISAIQDGGGIIEAAGDVQGRAQLAYAGHDLATALDGADLVYVVGPSYATVAFARACRDHLRPGQHVVVCPGTNGGAIVFKQELGLELGDPEFVVSETSTLPYACRLVGGNRVHVYLKLGAGLFMASLPSGSIEQGVADVAGVYPGVTPYDNVFQTLLQNGNNVIHPAVTLLNAARIESPEDFLFYEEGVTPGVGRLMEAVDRERLAIAEALGAPILSEPAVGVLQGYMTAENYDTAYSEAPGFRGIVAQTTLEYRYLTEDVGYGLILLTDLARVAGVATPAMDAIITLVSITLGRDLRAGAPRTLETLGLGGLGPQALRAAVES